MGFLEFILLACLVCAIAWVGCWVLGQFLPSHPAIVDRLIWGVAVLIIVMALIHATGILKYDPKIPSVR